MAKDVPYFQCYPSDFLAGLSGLEPQEAVLYFTIVLRNYDLGGPVLLKHYERDLCQRADMSRRKLAAALESLVARGKLEVVDGGYMNPRAVVEIEKISRIFEKNRASAPLGGRANAERLARQKKGQNESGFPNEINENGKPTGEPKPKPKQEPVGSITASRNLSPNEAQARIQNPERTQTSLDSRNPRDLTSGPSTDADRFERLRVECAEALGPDLAPADFVIGPMLLLADEIGHDKLLLILRSERDRPRRNKPRSWSIWAQNVREKLPSYEAEAYSTGMPRPESAAVARAPLPKADPDGRQIRVSAPRHSMPWSEFRSHVDRFDRDGYWPMSLGPEPGRAGCVASPDDVALMRSELKGVAA